jgi:hypothetical protein
MAFPPFISAMRASIAPAIAAAATPIATLTVAAGGKAAAARVS